MLENIINNIDEFLSQVCTDPQISVKGLADRVTTVANSVNTTQPKIYIGEGNYDAIDLDANCSYHRVLNETPITNAEGLKACTDLMTKTYNMRFVASIPKTLLGALEDDKYICDKMGNTFANVIQTIKFNLVKQSIKAASVETVSTGFNTSSFEIFNQEYTNVPFTFPTDRCLISVDYDLVIVANDDCLLNYFCGQAPQDSLLQICIDNSTCQQIILALENASPASKLDCVRKGVSNGFEYCIDFVLGQDDVFFFSEFEGEIDSVTGTNIFQSDITVNGASFVAPFQLNIGDFVKVHITKGDPNLVADLCLTASEFDAQTETLPTVLDDPLNVPDITVWLDAAQGITLNYQLQIGNLDTILGSNIVNAGTVATNFTTADIGNAIRIFQTSGNLDTYITAVNSATQIVINTNATDNEIDAAYFYGRVSNVADQANNNDYNQTTASAQPFYKFNVINNLPVIHTEVTNNLNATTNFFENFTIIIVAKSLETFTTSDNAMFYGTFSSTGHWFTEWANPSPYQLYWLYSGSGSTGSANTVPVPTGTVRDDFFISVDKYRTYVSSGEILTDNSGRIDQVTLYSNVGTNSTHFQNRKLQLGARGDGLNGGKHQFAELIVYSRALEHEEVEYLESYLKTKYQI